MKKYILALDAGTSSNRAILFDENAKTIASAQKEFQQIFPKPGWVEHNANTIYSTMAGCIAEVISNAGVSVQDIRCIGITNQRETTVVWDKNTGEPIYHAIVWQCRRTSEYCDVLKEKGYEKNFEKKQGFRSTPISVRQK